MERGGPKNFEEISILVLTLFSNVKTKMEILSNCVAFSEYLNKALFFLVCLLIFILQHNLGNLTKFRWLLLLHKMLI